MFGQGEHELELHVPASEAWDLFSGLRIGKVLEKEMPDKFQKVELIEGDGGVGTILKVIFTPGLPGPTSLKEKFTKIDTEKRIKEVEVVEGGYLDLGFTLYRIRLEVIEKGVESSIMKTTLEYAVKEEEEVDASLLSIKPLANVMEVGKNYLIRNKAAKEAK
ncbi:hypothetical protein P8452_31825 [Trifolium repens]|nr:hypothetical protein P8452_31825 [Trifolium repens]